MLFIEFVAQIIMFDSRKGNIERKGKIKRKKKSMPEHKTSSNIYVKSDGYR